MSMDRYQSIYFKNLQLLGFNTEQPYETILPPSNQPLIPVNLVPSMPTLNPMTSQTFSTTGAPPQNSYKYLELAIYFLVHLYNPELTLHYFSTCWPVLDAKVQGKEFKLGAFKCFEQIKKTEPFLNKCSTFIVRKSFLDDPKSER
jgi:HAUS augmin-like complex subunit 6 N-terminus